MSNEITLETVIDFLNEALQVDPVAITALFSLRVRCNPVLENHPTIQVGWFPKDGSLPVPGSPNVNDGKSELRLGILGILNGLLGVREDQWAYLSAVYDKPGGTITHFEETPRFGHRRQA
jgi:hypothetical protein